jgi:hypothetical protein
MRFRLRTIPTKKSDLSALEICRSRVLRNLRYAPLRSSSGLQRTHVCLVEEANANDLSIAKGSKVHENKMVRLYCIKAVNSLAPSETQGGIDHPIGSSSSNAFNRATARLLSHVSPCGSRDLLEPHEPVAAQNDDHACAIVYGWRNDIRHDRRPG